MTLPRRTQNVEPPRSATIVLSLSAPFQTSDMSTAPMTPTLSP